MRESRNGGGSYRGGWRRSFASHVPGSVLAAVPIYSNAGDTCLLVVDLDVKLGGREQVLTDAAAVAALVHRCGGELISDESPSGGIHLYIPLARPVAFDAAREVARALASRTPSMVRNPRSAGQRAGCGRGRRRSSRRRPAIVHTVCGVGSSDGAAWRGRVAADGAGDGRPDQGCPTGDEHAGVLDAGGAAAAGVDSADRDRHVPEIGGRGVVAGVVVAAVRGAQIRKGRQVVHGVPGGHVGVAGGDALGDRAGRLVRGVALVDQRVGGAGQRAQVDGRDVVEDPAVVGESGREQSVPKSLQNATPPAALSK